MKFDIKLTIHFHIVTVLVSSNLVQDNNAQKSDHVKSESNSSMQNLEMPVDLEIRLQKSKQQKRKFVPKIDKSRKRKKANN